MFSIVMPCDTSRLQHLNNTLDVYKKLSEFHKFEIIIVTRTLTPTDIKYYSELDIRIIFYNHKGEYFNPAKALNLGVYYANYDKVIITCPEITPNYDYLARCYENNNIVFEVTDENSSGEPYFSLVNTNFRGEHPGMYFLSKFEKKDIELINGWDLEFMNGYAWEDSDFGYRFKRSELKHIVLDGNFATHKYHPRETADSEGYRINQLAFERNNYNKVTRCLKGLKEVNTNE